MVCTPCIQAAEDETWSPGTGGEPADLCMSLGAQMSAHACLINEPCACTYPHAQDSTHLHRITIGIAGEVEVIVRYTDSSGSDAWRAAVQDAYDRLTEDQITGAITLASHGPTPKPYCPDGADICGGARCTRDGGD